MSTSKPATATNSGVVTDTLVTSNDQTVKGVRPQQTVRAVNAYGISAIRGGSELGAGFFQSISDAYCNVVSYQYVAAFFMFLSLVYYVTHFTGVTDPFTSFKSQCASSHKAANSTMHKSATAFATAAASLAVTYKETIVIFMSVSFPYFAKPSVRNAGLCAALFIYIMVVAHDPLTVLLLSHFLFLFVEMRNPLHKYFVASAAVLFLFIDHKTLVAVANTTDK
nr:MAG: ORF3 protein [Riboviria sp.]